MLFPNLDLYMQDDGSGILQRIEAAYSEAIMQNLSFWQESDTDTRFLAGDQTVWNELYGNLPSYRRSQYNFNRIRRIVNMITGHQRKNRKSIIVTPVDNGDNETADQFTKILMWASQHENILETISQAFEGSTTTGMALLNVWMDYRTDPVSGNMKVDYCPYNSFLIDPYFTKKDLSDCNYIYRRSFVTPKQAISLMPDKSYEIMNLPLNPGSGRDGKFAYAPQNYGYTYKNLLTYDEYYYRDFRNQKMLIDTQTGETMEWKSNDDDKLKQYLQAYPTVIVEDHEVPTVKLAVVVQGAVMWNSYQPCGLDRYPFVLVLAYYMPQLPYYSYRCQGVVRGLRDAQFLYNRRKVIELAILESQITSGWKFKEDALVDPNDVWNLSGQGKGLALKRNAQMTDVEQILPPQIPPSMLQISASLGDEIQAISGVSDELLGMADDDTAGIQSMLRQGAGLTTLQILFDNLDIAQKELGQLMIDLVQSNFTPGKVQRILGGQQPADQFYNKAFGTYRAVVEDGINTSTQRQMQYIQLLHMKEIGINIPESFIVNAATLENKNELIQAMEQQQQQAMQMQQQQQQLEGQRIQAEIELAKARSVADFGLGRERLSRIEENKALSVERRAAAEKDHQGAILDRVKAMKEIEGLDIDALHKIVAIANILKKEESEAVVQEGQQSMAQGAPAPVGL